MDDDQDAGAATLTDSGQEMLRGTAYHEAGHAVLAHLGDVRIASATVVPRAWSNGRVVFVNAAPVTAPADPARDFRQLIVSVSLRLAGVIAKARYTGALDLDCATGDLRNAAAAIDRRLGTAPSEARAIVIRGAVAHTMALVEREWSDIEAVAAALLHRRTLSGAEVVAIIAAARTLRQELQR